jgi:peptide/nickel transport system permease protein
MSGIEPMSGRRRARSRKAFVAVLQFLVVVATTYLGLLAVTFFIGRVIPIDPVLAVLGDRAPNHVVERTREAMGLNLPLYQQFFIYCRQAFTGDFGTSVLTTNPVMADIRRVFPATMELATLGTLIGAFIGVPLGVLAAVKRGSIADQVVRVIGLVGYSVPIFWLALLALLVFYARLQWVAYPGRIDIVYEYSFTPVTGFYLLDSAWQGQWDVFRDVFRHIILPASLLGYFSLAYISRMTRSFMLNELQQEYIVAARAKGLSEARIIWDARAAQCGGAAGDGDRALLCRPARRVGPDGDRIRLAGARPLHHQFAAECRHECRSRRHDHHRIGLHRHQSPVRPSLPDA